MGKETQGITNEALDSEFVTTDFEINKKIGNFVAEIKMSCL